MITDQDMKVASSVARRWRPDAVFSSEDAYQEMMLKLLEIEGSGKGPRLKGLAMKDAAIKSSIESSYMMKISASTYFKYKGAPVEVKYTGLSTDEPSDSGLGVPEDYLVDPIDEVDRVDNRIALDQALSIISEEDRALVLKWAEKPGSVSGRAWYRLQDRMNQLRAAAREREE